MSNRAERAKYIAKHGPGNPPEAKSKDQQEIDDAKEKHLENMYKVLFSSEAGKIVLKHLVEVVGLKQTTNPNQPHHCLTYTMGQQDIIKKIAHKAKVDI